MYHIFFTHSSVDGHVGSLHDLAAVNGAAINTGVHWPTLNDVHLTSLGNIWHYLGTFFFDYHDLRVGLVVVVRLLSRIQL